MGSRAFPNPLLTGAAPPRPPGRSSCVFMLDGAPKGHELLPRHARGRGDWPIGRPSELLSVMNACRDEFRGEGIDQSVDPSGRVVAASPRGWEAARLKCGGRARTPAC